MLRWWWIGRRLNNQPRGLGCSLSFCRTQRLRVQRHKYCCTFPHSVKDKATEDFVRGEVTMNKQSFSQTEKTRQRARKLADLEAHAHFLANAKWLFDRHGVVYFFLFRFVIVHGNRARGFCQLLHELMVPRQNSHRTFVQQHDSVCTLFADLPLGMISYRDAHDTRKVRTSVGIL